MGLLNRRRSQALSDRGSTKQGGPGCLIAFGLVFAAFGSIFVVLFLLLPLTRALDADDWVEVPCTILDSRVGESRDDDGTTYRVEVRYEYRFRPGDLESDPTAPRYESERYDFFEGVYTGGREEKEEEVRRLAPGTTTTCRVDPTAPDQAVLKAGIPDGLWIGLVTLIFPLVGFAMVVGGVVMAIRGRRGRSGTVGLSDGATTALGDDAAATAGFDDTPGRVELRPAGSRIGQLVFLMIFAAIWNGITWSIMLLVLLPEVLKGSWAEWFPLLFLSLFALIGLVLVGAVFHQLLALTNPRLRLTVNRRVYRPGQTLELEWECSGNPSRISTLTIALEGRESATYTRGTDTTTENHVFARLPLATLEDAGAILSGRAKLAVPLDAVPTFTASNNKLRWFLVVRGNIPRWPDINDEYTVTVMPAGSTP